MNQIFSLKRIGWLGKKEFYESFLPHFKILTIVVSSIILIRCVIEYFRDTFNESGGIVSFDYEGVFIVFAFIYTINIFNEFKLLSTRADYLTLPATAVEKVFTKWLFVNVIYWIGVALVYTVFYWIQKLVIGGLIGRPFGSFDLFNPDNLRGLQYLIIVFSVYFFGAATFNTGAWYKVIFWGILLSLVYMLMVFLCAYALFPELRAELHGQTYVNSNIPIDLFLEDYWIIKFAKFFILYLAAPFFWFMTYLKIKEKEV
ncbi:MAG: hypothetical protein IPO78_12425 [Saprospiraceae bacterium]|nr:hypothetical protein [Saprospiraceae bacterium]MBK8451277.1 hypothetical protein [Saprospiraceae bacterium]MBK9220751.1 hypothetical protein [Saprospiraceae bacterium]MBK9722404.1 hypothetical protein [Saprospiraceae bacterium]